MDTPNQTQPSGPLDSTNANDYQTLLESFAQAVWETDATGRVTSDSPSWRAYTGQTPEQWLGGGWVSAVHPDDRSQALKQWQQALETQTPLDVEYRLQTPDGNWRWTNLRATPMRNSDGSVRKWIGMDIDIAEKKRAEVALGQSEERFRAFVTATSDAVYRMSADWREMHQLVGKSFLFDTHTTSFSWLEQYIPLSEQPLVKAVIDKAIGERQTFELSHRVIRADGSLGWTFSRAIPLLDPQGEILEWFGTASDITPQKQAEEARLQADRRKDEFLAMLAHELRNPMATLRSGLQILTLTIPEEEMIRSTVIMMNRQTDHLVRMVDDLLDVSRISQGRIELRKERVDLTALVRQAVEAVGPRYAEQRRSLHVDLPPTAIYLEGDATRLSQLVTNLLINGARYTDAEGQVWLSLEHPTGSSLQPQAIIQVRDNGIGLAADQLSTIFELFMQVDNSLARSRGGLGVGLTLAKQLVAMHGGRIEVQSEGLGKGSTFRIQLPTLPIDSAAGD